MARPSQSYLYRRSGGSVTVSNSDSGNSAIFPGVLVSANSNLDYISLPSLSNDGILRPQLWPGNQLSGIKTCTRYTYPNGVTCEQCETHYVTSPLHMLGQRECATDSSHWMWDTATRFSSKRTLFQTTANLSLYPRFPRHFWL